MTILESWFSDLEGILVHTNSFSNLFGINTKILGSWIPIIDWILIYINVESRKGAQTKKKLGTMMDVEKVGCWVFLRKKIVLLEKTNFSLGKSWF